MIVKGERLKAARESVGMTRKFLASTAGLTQARIWQIETDESANLNPNIVAAMAKALRCSTEYLAGE